MAPPCGREVSIYDVFSVARRRTAEYRRATVFDTTRAHVGKDLGLETKCRRRGRKTIRYDGRGKEGRRYDTMVEGKREDDTIRW